MRSVGSVGAKQNTLQVGDLQGSTTAIPVQFRQIEIIKGLFILVRVTHISSFEGKVAWVVQPHDSNLFMVTLFNPFLSFVAPKTMPLPLGDGKKNYSTPEW